MKEWGFCGVTYAGINCFNGREGQGDIGRGKKLWVQKNEWKKNF